MCHCIVQKAIGAFLAPRNAERNAERKVRPLMRISAFHVAEELVRVSDTSPGPATIDDMAACISHGNGALRVDATRTVWLFTGSLQGIGNPDVRQPLVIRTSLRVQPRPGALMNTHAVALTFRDIARPGIGRPQQDYPRGYRRTWAPYATQPDMPVAMGGIPAGVVAANTIDVITPGNEFNWIDLEPLDVFPVGCLVYRFKNNGVLTAYQRISQVLWLNLVVQNAANAADLKDIKARLGFDEIEPSHTHHPRPVLFDPAG